MNKISKRKGSIKPKKEIKEKVKKDKSKNNKKEKRLKVKDNNSKLVSEVRDISKKLVLLLSKLSDNGVKISLNVYNKGSNDLIFDKQEIKSDKFKLDFRFTKTVEY